MIAQSFHRVQAVKLRAFSKFENTTDALAAATSVGDSKLGKSERCATEQTSRRDTQQCTRLLWQTGWMADRLDGRRRSS